MAIYHLSAQEFSRGAGHSAVHAAAYRARCELVDERTGLVHDYGRKAGELLFEGIYAPKDAPEWAHDRAQLWNHVEVFEKHRRALLAREFNIALPHELTLEQNRHALQDWIRDNFTRKGLIADAVIHAPGKDGDERNMHAHVMVVLRKLDGSEFARTKERFETYTEKDVARKGELETLRESWERIGNRHLERHGHAATLDRRSLLEQGIEREPTVHLGKAATAIERGGQASELGELNREIAARNVIDLAAERAARDATTGRREQVQPEPQKEAWRAPERSSSTRPAAARDFTAAARDALAPARAAPEPPWMREPPAARSAPELERPVPITRARDAGTRDAGDAAGRVAGGIGKAIGKAIEFLANLISPPPPLTPEQQERAERVDQEEDRDAAFRRYVAEQSKALFTVNEQIRGQQQERQREQDDRDARRSRDDPQR